MACPWLMVSQVASMRMTFTRCYRVTMQRRCGDDAVTCSYIGGLLFLPLLIRQLLAMKQTRNLPS